MPNVYICKRCTARRGRRSGAAWLCRNCRRWVCEHLGGFKKAEDKSCTCVRCLSLAEQERQAARARARRP